MSTHWKDDLVNLLIYVIGVMLVFAFITFAVVVALKIHERV